MLGRRKKITDHVVIGVKRPEGGLIQMGKSEGALEKSGAKADLDKKGITVPSKEGELSHKGCIIRLSQGATSGRSREKKVDALPRGLRCVRCLERVRGILGGRPVVT